MTEHADVTLHAIRLRAYQRWQERGRPDGSPDCDWLEAERELCAAAVDAAPPATPAAAAFVPAAAVQSAGVPRRRAPRSIVTRSGSAPAARLLVALVPDAAPAVGHGVADAVSRGRR